MKKELFEKYANNKNQIKTLTSENKELEPVLTDSMLEAGADKVKTEFGGFTMKTYKSTVLSDEQKGGVEELDGKKKTIEEEIEAIDGVSELRAKITQIEGEKEAIQSEGEVVEKKGLMFRSS